MKPHLFIFSLVCILVMGLLGEKRTRRKKPKGIRPMKTHLAFVPPGYKCKQANPINPAEISERIVNRTIGQRAKDIHEFHSNLYLQLNNFYKQNHLTA